MFCSAVIPTYFISKRCPHACCFKVERADGGEPQADPDGETVLALAAFHDEVESQESIAFDSGQGA